MAKIKHFIKCIIAKLPPYVSSQIYYYSLFGRVAEEVALSKADAINHEYRCIHGPIVLHVL